MNPKPTPCTLHLGLANQLYECKNRCRSRPNAKTACYILLVLLMLALILLMVALVV